MVTILFVVMISCGLALVVTALAWKLQSRVQSAQEPISRPEFGFLAVDGLDLFPEHGDCVWLPLSFLRRLVPETTRAQLIRYEHEHMAEISASLDEDGVILPLLIAYDNTGVCLHDGHHRVVLERLDYYPVKLERSEQIRKYMVPMDEFIELLWNSRRGKRVSEV